MTSLFPASVLALVSYYTTLLSTPTPRVSLLVAIADAPRLLAAYKALKWILRVLLWQGSELERVLQDRTEHNEGRIQLPDDDDEDNAVGGSTEDDEVALIHEGKRRSSATSIDGDILTSWRLDYSVAHSRYLKTQRLLLQSIATSNITAHEDLTAQVADIKYIPSASPSYAILQETLVKLNSVHSASERLIARSQQVYSNTNPEDTAKLREIWTLLQPDGLEVPQDLQSKQWQDLGFQGKDPSTDWRSVGTLGLDSLLYFARTFKKDDLARKAVVQAVKGSGTNQLGWYPFALASITITDFALRLLKLNSLSWFLVSSASLQPNSDSVANTLHHIVSLLLLHFHQHWIYLQISDNPQEANKARPVVMDFERIVKVWRVEVAKWVERGKIAGWVDSRGLVEMEWSSGESTTPAQRTVENADQ